MSGLSLAIKTTQPDGAPLPSSTTKPPTPKSLAVQIAEMKDFFDTLWNYIKNQETDKKKTKKEDTKPEAYNDELVSIKEFKKILSQQVSNQNTALFLFLFKLFQEAQNLNDKSTQDKSKKIIDLYCRVLILKFLTDPRLLAYKKAQNDDKKIATALIKNPNKLSTDEIAFLRPSSLPKSPESFPEYSGKSRSSIPSNTGSILNSHTSMTSDSEETTIDLTDTMQCYLVDKFFEPDYHFNLSDFTVQIERNRGMINDVNTGTIIGCIIMAVMRNLQSTPAELIRLHEADKCDTLLMTLKKIGNATESGATELELMPDSAQTQSTDSAKNTLTSLTKSKTTYDQNGDFSHLYHECKQLCTGYIQSQMKLLRKFGCCCIWSRPSIKDLPRKTQQTLRACNDFLQSVKDYDTKKQQPQQRDDSNISTGTIEHSFTEEKGTGQSDIPKISLGL